MLPLPVQADEAGDILDLHAAGPGRRPDIPPWILRSAEVAGARACVDGTSSGR